MLSALREQSRGRQEVSHDYKCNYAIQLRQAFERRGGLSAPQSKWRVRGLIAGGHSLIPLMKTRLVSPEVLIDLSAIDGLSGISSDTNGLNIGAMTSYEELESSDAVNEGA